MKDALLNMLTILIQNSTFLGQLSGDVSALKAVVFALGPEARAALEEQLAVQNDRIQQYIRNQQIALEVLRQQISQLRN
jgi:hypothetical protein